MIVGLDSKIQRSEGIALPKGFYFRGRYFPTDGRATNEGGGFSVSLSEFTGAEGQRLETRSLSLLRGGWGSHVSLINFRNVAMAPDISSGDASAFFESHGNAIWGKVRKGVLLSKFEIHGASVNRVHLMPYLWKKLVLTSRIHSVIARMPHSSPMCSLYPDLIETQNIWIRWPSEIRERELHFYAPRREA